MAKKKILLLSDDLRMNSGVATVSREIVIGTAYKYDWVQIAGAINHPEKGKVISLNDATNKMCGINDAYVMLYPVDGYGDENILYTIIDKEKPDVITHFTDPRFWGWLYQLERGIRSMMPLTYLNIWDDIPYPMYNRPYYESCDLLMSISKQSYNINHQVLGDKNVCTVNDNNMTGKTLLHYVPHGINSRTFKPLPKDEPMLVKMKEAMFRGMDYKYVVFYNSRNVQRKRTSNIMLAFRTFCDNLPPEEAKTCCLVLHTEPKQDAGTDLLAVKEAFCPDNDVIFSHQRLSPEEMNVMYNIADITINLSSNEGFGLSTAESIMSGTPIIVNVTGGLQDQIGQTDDDGNPIVFNLNFGTNNVGKYKKHGVWVKPVWPSTRCVQGSIPTPYIFDDLAKWEDAADAMMYWYLTGPEKRETCGQKGREWAMGVGGLNSDNMNHQFEVCMDHLFSHWKPIKQFGLFSKDDYVGHIMPGSMGFEIPKIDKEKIQKEVEKITV